MLKIWKYYLVPGLNEIKMPLGATTLTVQVQHEKPCLWALVNDEEDDEWAIETRRFVVYGTGHDISDKLGKYIGTFQLGRGALVFHVFELQL